MPFRHGNVSLLDSLRAPVAIRQKRLGHLDSNTRLNYTHFITADDVRVAEGLGALVEQEFFAQDLPKLLPEAETASEAISEAVEMQIFGCGGWI